MSMITDRNERQVVLLSINHTIRELEKQASYEKRGNFALKY